MIDCNIIDDDSIHNDILSHYLNKSGLFKLNKIYTNGKEALLDKNFDQNILLFLDIEMPELSGIEFLESLSIPPPTVIISRKENYALDAFNLNCIDYLKKPISYTRFLKSSKKIQDYLKKLDNHVPHTNGELNEIFLKNEGIWQKIKLNNIAFVKANNDNCIITFDNKEKCEYKISLKDLNAKLPVNDFLRVHRSYIVHLHKIEAIDHEVIEVNNKTIPVSKTYIKELYKTLNLK